METFKRKYFENAILCGNCNGTGLRDYMDYCRCCNGTGIESLSEYLNRRRGDVLSHTIDYQTAKNELTVRAYESEQQNDHYRNMFDYRHEY